MTNLIRAEWTKLFTTRVWLGLLLGACVMVIGFAVLLTAFAGNPESGIPAVGTPLYEELAMANAVNVNVLFLIVGIIGMTQEYRHRTATPTFLTTPRRGNVVIAKLLAYAVAAALFALVVLVVNYAAVAVHAGARGAAPALDADNLGTLGSAGLALVIYAIIGVGLGALLRNQVGAIVGGLVYLFVIEPIIRSIPATSGAYKWMPGGALEALTATFEGPDLLEAWQGGLLLLGYGLLAALLGTFLAVRRDIA
ncbi:ABC transporter permease [Blastococcus sp. MG754426]|uniref:ABC transporter permease n=1 Tax=unclassified Blastococcus TaxID=2619396 RepID=UPI001EEFF240|nr:MULTISPECIES: ABC transporter permease [unclassified Blastococcus]MCF6505987.1 ABC transporter permease [Blastococcus sp. MG754426]MCF6510627.1 ABC transporter permease [Blastococcus sp. MG754427]MCF6737355.1 ABC transporter permease [Blastococcus sp. KM273129]